MENPPFFAFLVTTIRRFRPFEKQNISQYSTKRQPHKKSINTRLSQKKSAVPYVSIFSERKYQIYEKRCHLRFRQNYSHRSKPTCKKCAAGLLRYGPQSLLPPRRPKKHFGKPLREPPHYPARRRRRTGHQRGPLGTAGMWVF